MWIQTWNVNRKMKIKYKKENGQIRLPPGKQELVIVPKKEGHKTATVLAYINENGALLFRNYRTPGFFN